MAFNLKKFFSKPKNNNLQEDDSSKNADAEASSSKTQQEQNKMPSTKGLQLKKRRNWIERNNTKGKFNPEASSSKTQQEQNKMPSTKDLQLKKRRNWIERNNTKGKFNRVDQNLKFENKFQSKIERLEMFCEKDPENLILEFNNSKTELSNVYNSIFDSQLFVFLIKMLAKVSQSVYDENKRTILLTYLNPNFIQRTSTIILEMNIADNDDKRTNEIFWIDPISFWNNLHDVLNNFVNYFPTISCNRVPKLLKITVTVLRNFEATHNIEIPGDLLEKFETLRNKLDLITEETELKKKKNVKVEIKEPPDNFRCLSIYPTLEELTSEKRPFVRPNIIQGKYRDVEHYLDVHFRLLREDFVGPLRDSINCYLSPENDPRKKITNVRIYENVKILDIYVIKNQLGYLVQVPLLKNKNFKYKNSKKFMYGSLVCITDNNFSSVVFGKIVVREEELLENGQILVDFTDLPKNYKNLNFKLIECEIFFEPYYQVLTALQYMSENSFPLKSQIIYADKEVEPPGYIRLNPTFLFGLHHINVLGEWPANMNFGLNEVQLEAFKSVFRQNLVIIQGPPGTGKTFLGLKIAKTLIENRHTSIVVVSFTNHALDQFIEGLLPTTKNILRIGNQSKNDKIKSTIQNERIVFKSTCNFSIEIKKIQSTIKYINGKLTSCKKCKDICDIRVPYFNNCNLLSWLMGFIIPENSLKEIDIKLKNLIKIYDNIEEGELRFFQKYDLNKSIQQYETISKHILKKLQEGRSIENPTKPNVDNLYDIPLDQRWELYFFHLSETIKELEDKFKEQCLEFQRVKKAEKEVRNIDTLNSMRKSDVIGLTTTGAARLHTTLQALNPKIIIIEEAAEVLESHVVVSLSSKCEHLILIGDHQQLRPSTSNYYLNKHYHLGISLFERFVRNEMHYSTLTVQHRMRPELSKLIVPTIYPNLINHESVLSYPPVSGMEKCLFFIHHTYPEIETYESSRENVHEVMYLLHLARHLILNGYHPWDITIIAAYSGQMFSLRAEREKKMDNLLKEVNITVLDNFQGEESKIILLSLVRNNDIGKIGFLKDENRVCVALSRAREGLYIMGNMDLLCQNNKIWPKIKASLEEQNSLGEELEVRCQNHGNLTKIKNPEDFLLKCPEGGCNLICGYELKCGHKCTKSCHVLDQHHIHFKCKEVCRKVLCQDKAHICKKFCFEECGPCVYLVFRLLPCGHTVPIRCHINPELHKCTQILITKLACGHEVEKPCYVNKDVFPCTFPCESRLDNCGHVCERKCHINSDPDHLKYDCKKPCARLMKNCQTKTDDHLCKKMCYEECEVCNIQIKKERSCGHFHTISCGDDVEKLNCNKRCKRVLPCGHICKQKCSEQCGNCREKVIKTIPLCKHRISIDCCKEPDVKMCMEKCPLILDCGHQCKNFCHQNCTVKCEELVEHNNPVLCSHSFKIPCYLKNKTLPEYSQKLLKYCKEPCLKLLKCEHICTGTCGECMQGRIHKPCQENCGATLICGHPCKIPCRKACLPCKKKCFNKCAHSKCNKNCGQPCTKCSEPCVRSCPHLKCKKTCGTICSVPPCVEPCNKLLKCGHLCVGFCGDPCPPLCRICQKEELTDIFFGDEDEDDARFVLLVDCGHVMEEKNMTKWLTDGNNNAVGLKCCPKCKTPILMTQRYSEYTKSAFKDITSVKKKYFAKRDKKKDMLDLFKDLKKMNVRNELQRRVPSFTVIYKEIEDMLQMKNLKQLDDISINSVKIKLSFMIKILKITENNLNGICVNKNTMKHLRVLFQHLSSIKYQFSEQAVEDFELELQRFNRIAQLFKIVEDPKQLKDKINDHYMSVCRIVNSIEKYNDSVDKILREQLMELQKLVNNYFTLSEAEKISIVQAVGLGKGHWFKCPRGHFYAIGECGGAMEVAVCNECGSKIGGTSHRLLNDNAHAPEMDRSLYPAYSEAAHADIQFFY